MSSRLLRDITVAGVVMIGVALVPACGPQKDAPTFTDTSEYLTTQTSPTTPSPTP